MPHKRLGEWLRRHAAADRNRLTITVAPAQAERTFQIELPSWSIRLLAGMLAVSLVLILAGGVLYGKLIRDALLLRDLKSENAELRARADRIEALESEVARVDQIRKQLYTIAGVPDAGAVDQTIAAGDEDADIIAEPLATAGSDDTGNLPPATPLRVVPFRGPLSRGFTTGAARTPEHAGVDVAGAEGSPVAAAADGIVSSVEWDETFGNLLIIRHADGWETRYGHNQGLIVSQGDSVRAGQTVALLGSTGKSSAPHLHFEAHHDENPIDPGSIFPPYRADRAE